MKSRCSRVKGKIVGQISDDIRDSDFYQSNFIPNLERCLKLLGERQVEHIISYGLGEFVTGVGAHDSRFQLALLLLMYEHMLELGCPLQLAIEIYDPCFSDEDIDVLSSFTCPKFKMIEENEHCARKIVTSCENRCVLVYMPHMDREFYNNLLGANWDITGLSRLVILGNKFSDMSDMFQLSNGGAKTKDIYYVTQLVDNFSETKNHKKRRKRGRVAKTPKEEPKEIGDERALIELLVDDLNFAGGTFSYMSFHLMNNSWLKENASKIEQSRIKDWKCYIK